MIKTITYPYWVYDCPNCGLIHKAKKQNANYMDTWIEICPITEEPVMIINETFVDTQTFEELKSNKKSKQ